MTAFEDNMLRAHGHTAEIWLNSLPDMVQDLAEWWNLSDLVPCQNLSYNYVLSGMQDTQPIVLKIGINIDTIKQETEALQAFAGYGMVKVFTSDLARGAMLIERAVPGMLLKSLFPADDTKAITIACNMIDQLHKAPIPKNSNFPLLADQLQILDQNWDLPEQQLKLARKLKNDLLNNSATTVLLHGDLHYDNILSNQDGWVVIDPKGVVGDPIYDKIGCLIREPLTELMRIDNVADHLKLRVDQIAKYFNLETEKIINWTYVHTVMAICWSIEDKQDPSLMQKFLSELCAAANIKY